MKHLDLQKKKIPNAPGVYFFVGTQKEILYIGKATSIAQRLKSYFDPNIEKIRSLLIEKMVREAYTIEWVETDSVLEALLLEANLIRTHKPTYNTVSKDDRSYNHVVITKEKIPRIIIIRGKDLLDGRQEVQFQKVFGPFPNAALLKKALKIIQSTFKFYDTPIPVADAYQNKMYRKKIDFNEKIGLYPSNISTRTYAQTIRHITLFFEGKKGQVLTDLKKTMMKYGMKERFEDAQNCKEQIFALTHLQDVSLIKDESRSYRDGRTLRIEGYDVAHLGGTDTVGAMVVLSGDTLEKNEYRKFSIKSFTGADDPRSLREILERRLRHTDWTLPDIIVVDGGSIQKKCAEQILKKHSLSIPVVGVVKDTAHKPKRIIGLPTLISQYRQEILLANAEAHRFAITYHRRKRSVRYTQ